MVLNPEQPQAHPSAASTPGPGTKPVRSGAHTKHSLRWLKPGIFAGALAPLFVLAIRAFTDQLGANIIEQQLNQFGLVALVIWVASLLCSPLKQSLGWTWPMRIRRMLGLFVFFYACLHLLTYTVVDQQLDLKTLVEDVLKRPFILVGLLAFLLLIPLAITSTAGWVKRLGYVRWNRLHKLVYPAVVLACIHFLWRVKADVSEPMTYLLIVGGLLLVRVGWALKKKGRHA